MKKPGIASILAGLAAALLIVAGLRATAAAQDAPSMFKMYCARCHGDSGNGDGPDAATLQTHPRDFADCKLMATISDDTRFTAIKNGGAAVGLPSDMPAWNGGLTDAQIHALVGYIHGFCKK